MKAVITFGRIDKGAVRVRVMYENGKKRKRESLTFYTGDVFEITGEDTVLKHKGLFRQLKWPT